MNEAFVVAGAALVGALLAAFVVYVVLERRRSPSVHKTRPLHADAAVRS